MIGLILTGLASRAENTPLPFYGIYGSFAPYVDKDGCVNPIVSLDTIDFGNGLTLPLILNFSSAIRSPSPEFGQGWECPLFEAKVFDIQQNMKRVELLGGRQIVLVYNARTDAWKHFFSDNWSGKAIGDDFELTYVSGYKFLFRNGLISSMTTPDGRTILWNRSGAKVISLQESGKPVAMQIVYDKLGFAQQILLNPDKLGKATDVYDFSANLVYAGIEKIQGPNGRTISLNRSHNKALNPMLLWTDTLQLPVTLTWDRKTGKILSDNNCDYHFTEVGKDTDTWPKMFRTNRLTKKVESYYYDEKHGVCEQMFADGTVRRTERILTPGPNYKALRLVQETKNGQIHMILRHAYDDQGHVLLDAVGLANGQESVKQYTYDSAGRIVSYLLNGKTVWTNIYDANGILTERDIPAFGAKLAFNALPGGEVQQIVQNASGHNMVKTLQTQEWQKVQASFETARP